MEDKQLEAVEADIETMPEEEFDQTESELAESHMNHVIAISNKIDAYAKATDTIINAVIKRSFAGDWVCHAREGDPTEKQKANIGAAGAERIARFLGIREANWKDHGKQWSEDHKHYSYSYSADFTFAGRTVHATGIAGTRDVFFSKEHGKMKPIEDIDEDDIRKAAFRGCRKEGVRTLLGIRSIPVLKLKELGYDTGLISFAGFQKKGTILSQDEKKADDQGLVKKTIKVANIERMEGKTKEGKPWLRFDVFDEKGTKFAFFTTDASSRLSKLRDRLEDQLPVEISFSVKMQNGFENYQLVKVQGVEND